MSERPEKMWGILNVVPIIECQTAPPEHLAELRKKAEQNLRAMRSLQEFLEKPVSEVFPVTPANPIAETQE